MLSTKGRPTKLEQLEYEKILRPYFGRTLSASFTSKQTGINIKTVCNYFDKWASEIREIDEKDFFVKQRKEREKILVSYDDLIFQEYNILDDIKDEIDKYKREKKNIPKFLASTAQDIIKTISSLIDKKGLFAIQPSLDEVIEQKIQERLNTNGQTS